jgi:hypothetical protein
MSFDQLSAMERQPTTMRRTNDPEYQDDPEFNRFTEDLSVKLFGLTSNISRLSQQVGLLGTKRDTERVRERVHDLLEEAREGFKDVGEGIKKVTAWDDLNVGLGSCPIAWSTNKWDRPLKSTLNRSCLENSKPQARSSRQYSVLPSRSNEQVQPLAALPLSLAMLLTYLNIVTSLSSSSNNNNNKSRNKSA